jgi:hypothetical protein
MMLSPQDLLVAAPRRRSHRSLRQQYDLYIMDRIEHYKNSISRDELLRLATEAMADARGDDDDQQFLLTEVLMETIVDEFIKRRLGIRSFDAWKKHYPKLRAAQRDPTHWGLDPSHLVAGLAPRLEPDDPVLVVGGGAESAAYLLAAHDADVTFLDHDVATVERAEHRVVSESLSCTFDALLVVFGDWLPCIDGGFSLVVIDAGTLAGLTPGGRRELLAELQRLTVDGGVHALVPDGLGSGAEGFAAHYASWAREALPPAGRRPRTAPSRGALFVKPREAQSAAMERTRA